MTARRLASLPRLPRAAAAAVALAMLAGPGRATGQPVATSVYARSGTGGPPAAEPEAPAQQAERIIAGALAALDRAPSLHVEFRHKARIDSRVVVGKGRYLQSGNGEEQRYRFESLLRAETESFETTEVCDGVTAWSYRRMGVDPPRLERLDVRRARERIAEFGPTGNASMSRHLGGLQHALWTARQWFRFQTATAADVDGLQAWVVEGRWHPDSLAAIEPKLEQACRRTGGVLPEELPDGMPWSIRVTVARTDLLPRRVEYLAIPGPRPAAARPPEPIAVLDLFDVRVGQPVDASAFLYRPAPELGQHDITDATVPRLGPMRP